MTKKFLTFGILFIVLTGILLPSVVYGQDGPVPNSQSAICQANPTSKECQNSQSNVEKTECEKNPNSEACLTSQKKSEETKKNAENQGWGAAIADAIFTAIGHFLMAISAFILVISGKIFDFVVNFTVIEMAKNIGTGTGVGGGITAAWEVLRDIANMCFIFVLLFAAFKAMFQSNFSNLNTTIRNIIIVALLINFSLFFSKVVIDASNIVSVGFYKSIAGANTKTYELKGTEKNFGFNGISGGYMRMLGLQTFFSANILESVAGQPVKVLTLGVVSSVFMLISAIVLLIAGIMFAARFIILIFLMILSPLALIAYIIPGQQKRFEEWKDSLISQSFFAPLFFALTWVVFKVGSSLVNTEGKQWTDLISKADDGAITLLLNYVLIIGFSIAALVISKTMATSGAAGTAFKAVAAGAGAATIGAGAWAGRNTIGWGSKKFADSSMMRNAASSDKWYAGAARAGLWTANKGKAGSFDARAVGDTKLMKSIGADKYANDMLGTAGKAGGKGGYAKASEDKAKEKAKYAKDVYGQTDEEKDKAKNLQKDFDIAKATEEKRIKDEWDAEVERRETNAHTEEEKKNAAGYKEYIRNKKKKNIFDKDDYSSEYKESDAVKEYEKYAKAGEKRQEAFAKRLEGEKINTGGAISASLASGAVGAILAGPLGAAIGTTIGAGIGKAWAQSNKAAARKVRDESKGPTKEKKLADAYKDIAETDSPDTITPTVPATPSAPTPPPPPTPPNP